MGQIPPPVHGVACTWRVPLRLISACARDICLYMACTQFGPAAGCAVRHVQVVRQLSAVISASLAALEVLPDAVHTDSVCKSDRVLMHCRDSTDTCENSIALQMPAEVYVWRESLAVSVCEADNRSSRDIHVWFAETLNGIDTRTLRHPTNTMVSQYADL